MNPTPATAPSPAEGAEESRRRILDAAERVFAERGFSGATTREIAECAGMGKRMVFYYFASKQAVYRAVLARLVEGMAAIHERFRNDPGPVGLAEAVEGITHFAAVNLNGVRVLTREIMDGGPLLPELVRDHLAPLFARGGAEVARNQAAGVFAPGDPMHVLVSVGGLTLYYFLLLPLLELVWDRDPLAPEVVTERAAAARDFLMHGLAGPAAREETRS
jgi:TetR/AcrR family transcriptional regulator